MIGKKIYLEKRKKSVGQTIEIDSKDNTPEDLHKRHKTLIDTDNFDTLLNIHEKEFLKNAFLTYSSDEVIFL